MEFATWLAFFAASWAISISPGAGAVAAMSAGLSHGFRRGYLTTLGLVLGIWTQMLVVSVGLGALVTEEKLKPGVVAARVAHGLTGVDADHRGCRLARRSAEATRRRLRIGGRRGGFEQRNPRPGACGGTPPQPVGLQGGDDKIGRDEHRDGLGEQQPDAFHEILYR